MAVSSVTGASQGFTQDTFLKLFVTQITNQNPMEPMDNYQFTSQLAQMGQLEQVTALNSRFEQFLRVQEFGNAGSLIGRRVRYVLETGADPKEGAVSGVRLDDGTVKLVVGDDLVPLSAVTEVTQAQ